MALEEYVEGPRTSGDSSSKIFAPRVSTWMTRGAGRDMSLGVLMVWTCQKDGVMQECAPMNAWQVQHLSRRTIGVLAGGLIGASDKGCDRHNCRAVEATQHQSPTTFVIAHYLYHLQNRQ
jgi:hypothetical protein